MKRPSFKKQTAYVFLALTGTIVVLFYAVYYHDPKPEREFLSSISLALGSGNAKVSLSNVVTSDWTRVCYLSPHTVTKTTSDADIRRLLDVDSNVEVPPLSELSRYNSAFVFVQGREAVAVLKLKKPYIQIGNGKYPFGLSNTRHYKDRCMTRESAYFVLQGSKLVLDDQ